MRLWEKWIRRFPTVIYTIYRQYIFIIDIYRHRLTICAQCTIDIENIGIVDDEIKIIFY